MEEDKAAAKPTEETTENLTGAPTAAEVDSTPKDTDGASLSAREEIEDVKPTAQPTEETVENMSDGALLNGEVENEMKDDEATAHPTEETVENTVDVGAEDMDASGVDEENKTTKDPRAKGSRSSTRERKSYEAYVPPSTETSKKFKIPDGKGEKLGDLPNIVSNLKGVTMSSDVLKDLHTVVFGGKDRKRANFKSNLMLFSGLVFTEGEADKQQKEKDKVLERMYKLKMDDLKAVMDLADVNRAKMTDKDSLCNAFLAWLEKPTASGKKVKNTPKKRKSSEPSKKASIKKTSAKKTSAKKTPAKKTSAKKATSSSSGTPEKKKLKKETSTDEVNELSIPGVTREQLTEKVRSLIASADHGSVTVKDIRTQLENFLDIDLTPFKDEIRGIVMGVLG